MKNLFLILFIAIASISFSQKQCKVKVKYKFDNIQEGYDHKTKCMIYVDGSLKTESFEHLQSVETTIPFKVDRGTHEIKVVNMTFYEGKWEERSIANGYSTEGVYKNSFSLGKKKAINITFDLNQPDPVITIK